MEDLAHLDAAGDQLATSCVDVVHGEDQLIDRARFGGSDALAEDDRRLRIGRSELDNPEVFIRDVVDI